MVDYNDIFAVARFETIKLIVSMVTQNGCEIHEMDVQLSLFEQISPRNQSMLESFVYVVKGHKHEIFNLKEILVQFKVIRFIKCPYEHALYQDVNIKGDILIFCQCVDDLIFTRKKSKII